MEFIDDHPVTGYQVRFRYRCEVDETNAAQVRDGDVILWLVRARCQPPQYHAPGRESEERYRLNIQDVEGVAPLTGALRESAIAYIDHGQDQSYISSDGQTTLPLDHAFQVPLEEAIAAASVELAAVQEYLADLGELHEGERPVDAVRRLVEAVKHPTVVPQPEMSAVADETYVPYDRVRVPDRSDSGNGAVEVVGTIYRNGRRSPLQDLLEQSFEEKK